MALLKYFKRVEAKRTEKVDSILPKSDGPLATLMPSSAIQAANSAVHTKMLESGSCVADADDEDESKTSRWLPIFYSNGKGSVWKKSC